MILVGSNMIVPGGVKKTPGNKVNDCSGMATDTGGGVFDRFRFLFAFGFGCKTCGLYPLAGLGNEHTQPSRRP